MNSRDFVYWMQGFFEIANNVKGVGLSVSQVEIIKRHLNLVFKHEIDPSFGDEKHLQELDEIHREPTGEPTPVPAPMPSVTPQFRPDRTKLMC